MRAPRRPWRRLGSRGHAHTSRSARPGLHSAPPRIRVSPSHSARCAHPALQPSGCLRAGPSARLSDPLRARRGRLGDPARPTPNVLPERRVGMALHGPEPGHPAGAAGRLGARTALPEPCVRATPTPRLRADTATQGPAATRTADTATRTPRLGQRRRRASDPAESNQRTRRPPGARGSAEAGGVSTRSGASRQMRPAPAGAS